MGAIQQALLAEGGATTTDPNWASVVWLLNYGGANNSTTFTDSTGRHTWSNNGSTAKIDTSLGYNTLRTDGSATCGISTPTSTDFVFGTGDFTIELFGVRFNTLPSNGVMSFQANYDGSTKGWSVQFRNDAGLGARLNVGLTGDTGGGYKAWSPSTGTNYDIAICRSGTTLYFFVNGTSLGTLTDSSNVISSTQNMWIGGLFNGGLAQRFDGWIRASRGTKGVCRYTSNYTPETPPLPTS